MTRAVPLRLVSWNIHKGRDLLRRPVLSRLRRELRALAPDAPIVVAGDEDRLALDRADVDVMRRGMTVVFRLAAARPQC